VHMMMKTFRQLTSMTEPNDLSMAWFRLVLLVRWLVV
jgi:hypothetical protein